MILIIGAGAAGIAAARRLRELGYEARILEARGRVGGRAWTAEIEGNPIDLGAAWIHGTRGNVMAQIARSRGHRVQRTAHGRARVVDGAGRSVDAAGLFRHFFRWLAAAEADAPDGVSLAEHLEDWLRNGQGVVESPDELRRFFSRFMEQWLGGGTDAISARDWNADEDLPGGDGLLVNGYGTLLSEFARDLDIQLDWPVAEVALSGVGVRVTAVDGRVEEGEAVIVTLPLGVLKAGSVRFDPELPRAQRRVIERMGYGALEKVVACFDAPFWGEEHHLATLPASEIEPWASFYPLTPYGHGAVLVAFTGGPASAELHRWSDDRVIDSLCQTLERLGPVPTRPRIVRTRWLEDPYSRGSYSFPSIHSNPSDYDRLSRPHADRILFAGEATHRAHPATVHGAYTSGIREAERLANRAARVA